MKSKKVIKEDELSHWKLIERFQHRLRPHLEKQIPTKSMQDPRRTLDATSYFSLLLFHYFNPVIESMRGLCAATHLQRVQQEVSSGPVSLGSFSEAQHLFDPDLLRGLLQELSQEVDLQPRDSRLKEVVNELCLVDGTLIHTLRRMRWAYREDFVKRAAKLHVKYHLWKQVPIEAELTEGACCERKALRKMLRSGEWYVADGYYSGSYGFIQDLKDEGCGFVFRVSRKAVLKVIDERKVTDADREANVIRDAWVTLGGKQQLEGIRYIEIRLPNGDILPIICHDRYMPAELIANIYRHRWHIELFFKWLKSLLKSKHLLAESPQGVALHMYSALIAAVLLTMATRRRPGKRELEMIQHYLSGWASLDELVASLELPDVSKN